MFNTPSRLLPQSHSTFIHLNPSPDSASSPPALTWPLYLSLAHLIAPTRSLHSFTLLSSCLGRVVVLVSVVRSISLFFFFLFFVWTLPLQFATHDAIVLPHLLYLPACLILVSVP